MGEANLRAEEIAKTKADAEQAMVNAQMQKQQMAQYREMTKEPAVFVNGVYYSAAGELIRMTMIESTIPQLPSNERGSFVMTEDSLDKILGGGAQVLQAMRDAKKAAAAAALGTQADFSNATVEVVKKAEDEPKTTETEAPPADAPDAETAN